MRTSSLLLLVALVVAAAAVVSATTMVNSNAVAALREKIEKEVDSMDWKVEENPTSLESLGCACKDQRVAVGPCSVKVNVCGCLKGIKWKYKCSASVPSGRSASYSWTKSGKGCASHVIVDLFNGLTQAGECNCVGGAQAVGKCNFNYNTCFYFGSEGQMDAGQLSWRAFVSGAPTQGTSSGQASPEAAVAAGISNAMSTNPAWAAQCQALATESEMKEAAEFGQMVMSTL